MKQEPKDTLTKDIYNEMLDQIKREGKGRWFGKSNNEESSKNDNKLQPIRNIFKMSRILVDVNEKKK